MSSKNVMHTNKKKTILTSFRFENALLRIITISLFFMIQISGEEIKLKKMNKPVTINMNQSVRFENGLTIELTGFSHKRPRVGGPTKASAYLKIRPSKLSSSEEIIISQHGTDGQKEIENEKIVWRDYTITLLDFHYDESITIKIEKKMNTRSKEEYLINAKPVTKEKFQSFLATLKEVTHTWFCAESDTGGRTGYNATDEKGIIYEYREITEGDRNSISIHQKPLNSAD